DERAQRHHGHGHHDQGEQDPAAAADPPVRHRRPRLPRNARSHGLAARSHGLTARTHVLATGSDGLAARAHRLAARLRDLAAGPAADLPGPLIAGLDEPTAVIDEALPGAGLNESRPPQIGPGQRGSRAGLEDRKSTRLNSSHVSIAYSGLCLEE